MEDEETFQCDVCSKIFRRKKYLQAHIRSVHLEPKAHPCSKCGDVFMDPIVFQHHMLTHTGKPILECAVCQKLFSRQSSLRTHMRLHTKDKKFECPKCGKSNGTKYDLSCHLRTHTGERPYQCHLCQPVKAFATRSSLMRHVRTHSGYQPHVCKTCKKTFARKDQYSRHINKHLVYHCQGCNEFFDTLSGYTRHRNSCTNALSEAVPQLSSSESDNDDTNDIAMLPVPNLEITFGEDQITEERVFDPSDVLNLEADEPEILPQIVETKLVAPAVPEVNEAQNVVFNVIIENDELDHRIHEQGASDEDCLPAGDEGKSLIIVEQSA